MGVEPNNTLPFKDCSYNLTSNYLKLKLPKVQELHSPNSSHVENSGAEENFHFHQVALVRTSTNGWDS
jgi:hypothetical protein